jgi:hypothetical protein
MAAHSFLWKLLNGAEQDQGEICFHHSHALVHDVPEAEIFSLTSIVSIVASSASGLSEHSRIVYRQWKNKLINPPDDYLYVIFKWHSSCHLANN